MNSTIRIFLKKIAKGIRFQVTGFLQSKVMYAACFKNSIVSPLYNSWKKFFCIFQLLATSSLSW